MELLALITIIVKPNCRINIEYLKTTLFEIFIDKLTFSTLVERYRFIYEKLVYVSSFLSLFKLSLIYLLPLNSAWETKKPNFAKGHRDIIPSSKIKEKERKLKTENEEEEEEEEEKEYKQTVR